MQEQTLAEIRNAYLEHRWDDWCRLVDEARATEWGKDHPGLLTEAGVAHLYGWGRNRDARRAFQLFKRAAKSQHSEALYWRGSCYHNGLGTPIDLPVAARLFEQAASQGHARAKYYLGRILTDTFALTKDEARANALFAQALPGLREEAEAGCIDAAARLGSYLLRRGSQEAVAWLRLAAKHAEPAALTNMGVCYADGTGVPKDPKKAARCYHRAAEQGDAVAQNNLGVCYQKGEGVSKNPEEAVRWYREAAEQGLALAQHNLGFCYANGKGVSKNPEEAVRWYRKAAEQGDAGAQNNLGNCYWNGEGVSKDPEEAVRWYRKAAEQGDAGAQNNLGNCYWNGEGVSKDPEEAVRWYREAAEQGDAGAQYNLGVCYQKGEGVSKNPEEAVRWYREAAEQGLAVAQYSLGLRSCGARGYYKFLDERSVEWLKKAAEQGHKQSQDIVLLKDAHEYLLKALIHRKLVPLLLSQGQQDGVIGPVTAYFLGPVIKSLPEAIKSSAERFPGVFEGLSKIEIIEHMLKSRYASIHCWPELADLWRESPELLTQRPLSGDTALVSALKDKQLYAVRALLALGADVRIASADGMGPADVAPNEKVLRMLYKRGADLGSVIHRALSQRYLGLIEDVAENCVVQLPDHCANARDGDGHTPLHLAIRYGRVRLVKILMRHKVDMNARDKTGATPLHEASRRGDLRLVTMLLQRGADANAQTASMLEVDEAYLAGTSRGLKRWFSSRAALRRLSPFQVASSEEVALALLEAGAQPDLDRDTEKKASRLGWKKIAMIAREQRRRPRAPDTQERSTLSHTSDNTSFAETKCPKCGHEVFFLEFQLADLRRIGTDIACGKCGSKMPVPGSAGQSSQRTKDTSPPRK